MPIAAEETGDEGAPGFFRRNRVTRRVVGGLVSVVLIAACLFGIQSYRAGLAQALPVQAPPAGGVSVVIVPEQVSPNEQELEVRIQPALSGQTLLFPAGEATAPQTVVLPAAGTVQEYPFDTYAVDADVQVHSLFADGYEPLPTQASVFFRVPGWSSQVTAPEADANPGTSVSAEVARDGSTKSIALLLLLLMDILVFFWVELILMLSVAAVVTTILMRENDARHHPKEGT